MRQDALRTDPEDYPPGNAEPGPPKADQHLLPESVEPLDPQKFENVLQVGGIRTGALDQPNPNGGQSCRVAFVDTGGGLRFTVAVDRGGDVVEASCNGMNLAYLTPNDYTPPSHAYNRRNEWLSSWPGGLITTCGPSLMGESRNEDGRDVPLHGHHSNTPASIDAVVNPDPSRGRFDMSISMTIRDTRMFGPNIEVRRTISAVLGGRSIQFADEVINRGDEPCSHGMLYHLNFGYPLLDEGARLILGGRVCQRFGLAEELTGADQIECFKVVPAPSQDHRGTAESILIVEPSVAEPEPCRVGLINEFRGIGVEVAYPLPQLPRLGGMLHCGPRGSYMAALEPFSGSIVGKAADPHPESNRQLAPGASQKYDLRITVHTDPKSLEALSRHDYPLVVG
ncbi:MAG TPA: DUF4432 family protein [Roseibacillus sp.]|nr:DUF4432 family protein [Roseibacillus sp.]